MAFMSNHRKLLQLLRSNENRRCADCDAFLNDSSQIWGCISFGAFICTNCMVFHKNLKIPHHRDESVQFHNWTAEDVQRMENAGNQVLNQVYERYVPTDWVKPSPEANGKEREFWICAKYQERYFMIPDYGNQSEGKSHGRKRGRRIGVMGKASAPLPSRLVDFFLVCGLDPESVPPADEVKTEERPPSLQRTAEVAGKSRRRYKTRQRPHALTFEGEVLDCYPPPDSHKDCPLPDHVCQFIFPQGVSPLVTDKDPTMFSFVLTNVTGIKMYGVCLHIYEQTDLKSSDVYTNLLRQLWDGNKEDLENPKVFIPKALVLLSHYPFFNAFGNYLCQLYRISISSAPLPIERYIGNFVCETALPPQGQTDVLYALPDRTLVLSRPSRNQPPLADFSYRPLFSSLSVENVITVFACLLIESKVAVISIHYALLTPVCEALISFLFPFSWQGSYIPVLPARTVDILDAPIPFLVGLHSSYFHMTDKRRRPAGVTFVDLDNNEVIMGIDEDTKQPVLDVLTDSGRTSLYSKLILKLREHAAPAMFNRHREQMDQVDLAFISQVSPIYIFATEQGYTELLPAACDTPRNLTHLLSKENNFDPEEGFDGNKIRESFLDFFTSLLAQYRAHLIKPTKENPYPDSLFNRETFLNQCRKSDTNTQDYLQLFLQSQMFERFLEERVTFQDLPELEHFENSVELKRNKITKKKKIMKYTKSQKDIKIASWFTQEQTEKHVNVHTPQPSNWNLEEGESYSYPSFPRLEKERFGKIRPPPDNFNTQAVSKAKNDEDGPAYKIPARRTDPFKTVQGIIKAQSWWRCFTIRIKYIEKVRLAHVVGRLRRRVCIPEERTRFLYLRWVTVRIQSCWRRYMIRRNFLQLRWTTVGLQTWVRWVFLWRLFQKQRQAASLIQRTFRSFLASSAFRIVRAVIIFIQTCCRGYLGRCRAAEMRALRARALRNQLFELWRRAHTPLVWRARFWLAFDGSGSLHLSICEDELQRLWQQLNLFPYSHEVFEGGFRAVQEYLSLTARNPHLKPPAEDMETEKRIKLAAECLELERYQLYEQIKIQMTEEQREPFYDQFNITVKQARKRKLALLAWQDLQNADASANLVHLVTELAAAAEDGESGAWRKAYQAWATALAERRIRQDLTVTLHNCLDKLDAARRQQRQHAS